MRAAEVFSLALHMVNPHAKGLDVPKHARPGRVTGRFKRESHLKHPVKLDRDSWICIGRSR